MFEKTELRFFRGGGESCFVTTGGDRGDGKLPASNERGVTLTVGESGLATEEAKGEGEGEGGGGPLWSPRSKA